MQKNYVLPKFLRHYSSANLTVWNKEIETHGIEKDSCKISYVNNNKKFVDRVVLPWPIHKIRMRFTHFIKETLNKVEFLFSNGQML